MKDLFKEYKNPERGVLSKEILNKNYWRSILPIPYAPPHLYTFPGQKKLKKPAAF